MSRSLRPKEGLLRFARGGSFNDAEQMLASDAGFVNRLEILRVPLMERAETGSRLVRLSEPRAALMAAAALAALFASSRVRKKAT